MQSNNIQSPRARQTATIRRRLSLNFSFSRQATKPELRFPLFTPFAAFSAAHCRHYITTDGKKQLNPPHAKKPHEVFVPHGFFRLKSGFSFRFLTNGWFFPELFGYQRYCDVFHEKTKSFRYGFNPTSLPPIRFPFLQSRSNSPF